MSPSSAPPTLLGKVHHQQQPTTGRTRLTVVRDDDVATPDSPPWSGSAQDRLSRALLVRALDRLGGGRVALHEGPDHVLLGSAAPDRYGRASLRASVRVHHPGAYRRVVREASIGLGESYADGWWDADDLTAFLRLLSRSVRRADPWRRVTNRIASPVREPWHRLRRQDHHRDREHIRAHYDLGNDFFERLLDETMMYSCGVFPSPTSTMAEASTTKLDRLCRLMGLGPDDHLLEIGTGWGGFAVHAAQRYGCRVTTTTISDRQFEYAVQRVHEAGLDDRVTVLDQDYRHLRGRYDGIVSIEMIEAVDWREYDTFFRACDRLLTPTGRLAMQAIVTSSQRFELTKNKNDFIKEVIFPGGCLPSVEALVSSAARVSDLSLVGLDDIGAHYGETLRRWRANLDECRPELSSMGLDQRFARLWEFYLCYCEAGFEERDISTVQLVLARPGFRPDSPTTREPHLLSAS